MASGPEQVCQTEPLSLQLKMVLIKCCDISNEVRPMEVAEPWVDCLLEEYFMQVGQRSEVRCPFSASVLLTI